MALSSGKSAQVVPIRTGLMRMYTTGGKTGMAGGFLDKLIGDTGTKDKPIQVTVTHELAPLHEPVVKYSLMVIAGCAILLLINQVRKA